MSEERKDELEIVIKNIATRKTERANSYDVSIVVDHEEVKGG